jgi:predicted nucleic acid-binding protein
MKIYLDVCCLNRPFDDQSQDRIHLEAEAVILVLKHLRTGKWKWISSDVVDYEVSKILDIERRHRIETLLRLTDHTISINDTIMKRASELKENGFGIYDATHLACAESYGVDIFLTTDDQIVKFSRRRSSKLKSKVDNPWLWLKEVFDNE